MICLDRQRHQLAIARIEKLAKDNSRHCLVFIETARVLETRERNPWKHRVINKIKAIGFDIICFKSFVFFKRGFSRPVKFDDIVLHLKISERECFVVVKYRLRCMDAVELDQPAVHQAYPELTYFVDGDERIIERGERKRETVLLAKAIDSAYIEIRCDVEKWIVVVLKKLVGRPSRPFVDIQLGIHFCLF